eukprot:UN00941
MITSQQKAYNWKGFIVTNPNCTTTGTVTTLAPLHRKYGIKKLFCTSLRAVSGAGYPGVPSMDILDNVVTLISGEEEKMQWEASKIFGEVQKDGTVKFADFAVSAHCNRVGVTDGHTVCVSVELQNEPKDILEVEECIKNYLPEELYQYKSLMPSLPERPIRYREEPNRPQPRFDR